MSHQTGIEASKDLREFFATLSPSVRAIKISIVDEQLTLVEHKPASGDYEADYDGCVEPMLEESQPCYILYRLDTTNDQGSEWIFISYSPDFSPVRQKMLYAATLSTLKQEFGGSGRFREELFGTTKGDVLLAGYKKHLEAAEAPAPLTAEEYEKQLVMEAEAEARTQINTSSRSSHLVGLNFPMTSDAMDHIRRLCEKKLQYVSLAIDVKKEEIYLGDSASALDVDGIAGRVPEESPRYHFYLYKHTFESDYMESIVFLYSCPGFKSSIRERMLYSSCKAPLSDSIESQYSVEIAKKIEIETGADIAGEDWMMDQVHPAKIVYKQKFARPAPPGGRRRTGKH